jgi:hypothetical protein
MGSKTSKKGHKSSGNDKPRNSNRNSRRRAYELRSRKKNRAFLQEYLKTHHCVDCGEADLIVLEFDHVRGVKKACVRQMARDCAMESLVREVRKCEVRCSNCHKRRHYLLRNPEYISEALLQAV